MGERTAKNLEEIYKRLLGKFGPQGWWPAQSRFEVIVGAILTQNTNWTNVERAIENLRKNKLLTPSKLRKVHTRRLASLIKPAGYFNVKAKRLKSFIDFLYKEYRGNLDKMSKEYWANLRIKLLAISGIGPETADSILLYALDKPVFVVDAYTKRFLARHNLVSREASYDAIQSIFMDSLPQDIKMFNEYHALIVRLGKELCKSKPLCEICPLNNLSYSINYTCYSCSKPLPHPYERYHMNLELYRAPEIMPTAADLKENPQAEVKSLVDELGKKVANQLGDIIYSSFKVHLCKVCHRTFFSRMKNKEIV